MPVLILHASFCTTAGDPFLTRWSGCAELFSDLNGDGAVDAADFSAMLAAWGACPAGCAADLDDDGVVGASDLLLLLDEWTG